MSAVVTSSEPPLLWLDAWVLGTLDMHYQAASLLAAHVPTAMGVDSSSPIRQQVLPIEQHTLGYPFFLDTFAVSMRCNPTLLSSSPTPPTFLLEHFHLDAAQRQLSQAFPHLAVAVCAQDRSRRLASEEARRNHVAAMVMLWAPLHMPCYEKEGPPQHFNNDIPKLNRQLTFCFADSQLSAAGREDPAATMSTGIWMMGGPSGAQLASWLKVQERGLLLDGLWGDYPGSGATPLERL